jgi:hypothetical protein
LVIATITEHRVAVITGLWRLALHTPHPIAAASDCATVGAIVSVDPIAVIAGFTEVHLAVAADLKLAGAIAAVTIVAIAVITTFGVIA